jgi:replication factor C subunit 3/5
MIKTTINLHKKPIDLSNKETYEVLPWIEKYRPSTLDEVISQNTIVDTLKKFIKDKKLPHLLFHGPPGSGKTSVVTACAKELYGINYNMMVIEINASEERGIEVVRNRITSFASKKSIIFDNSSDKLFKLVILDEADAMTPDAQASLRRVIEKYTHNVRFCLICNYIKKINIAVQSRCICFRFAPLKSNFIKTKLEMIIEKENIDISSDAVATILKRSKGDMRKVLNILQSTNMAYSKITSEAVNNCLGYPSTEDIDKLMNAMINESFSCSYKLLKKYKNEEGYAISDILYEVHDVLIDMIFNPKKYTETSLSVNQIRKIIEYMREIEHNITNSTSDNIHLGELIGTFKIVLSK